jgi:hypothetical protein
MPITIKGFRIEHLAMNRQDENGSVKITGTYSIISSADKVIAKQSFGDYNGIEIKPSADTIRKMDEFLKAFRTDLNSTLGMEGGEQ